MAAKTFWLAPLGVAQLSDLVLEGTSLTIKKQGKKAKVCPAVLTVTLWLFMNKCCQSIQFVTSIMQPVT